MSKSSTPKSRATPRMPSANDQGSASLILNPAPFSLESSLNLNSKIKELGKENRNLLYKIELYKKIIVRLKKERKFLFEKWISDKSPSDASTTTAITSNGTSTTISGIAKGRPLNNSMFSSYFDTESISENEFSENENEIEASLVSVPPSNPPTIAFLTSNPSSNSSSTTH